MKEIKDQTELIENNQNNMDKKNLNFVFIAINKDEVQKSWIVDSDATSHMCYLMELVLIMMKVILNECHYQSKHSVGT